MSTHTQLPAGKLPASLLRELLADAPALPPEVRLGPALGEDACAIDLPAGTLVAATDPITLTGSGIGAFSVAVNANDVAVMGVRPRWFMAAILLPLGSTDADARGVFASMRAALARTDAALVGGHTEITGAVAQPVVVGQMMGLSETGRIVRTGGVSVGDIVVQVGPAPIEAAAVLAEAAAATGRLDADVLDRARRAADAPGISVVEAALICAEHGATAMHDPTEGGLATGLRELADASGVGLRVDERRIAWFEPGVAACRALGADPWGALASGTLLAAFPAAAADAARVALQRAGLDPHPIATAESGAGTYTGASTPLPQFDRDEVARILSP